MMRKRCTLCRQRRARYVVLWRDDVLGDDYLCKTCRHLFDGTLREVGAHV